MLTHLNIRNFTIIEELDIDFRPGFSVITGETGAGKSIILGAIALLAGGRADSKSIRPRADKCVIEARFDLSKYDLKPLFEENDIDYDDECIIRRELTAAGKSRAFVNDTPAPLTTLRTLAGNLLDVHSQHQNLLLAKDDFQLSVADIIAGSKAERDAYQEVYSRYRNAVKDLEKTCEEIAANSRNRDFLQFQCDELSTAALREGEQEELETRSNTMRHAEDIKSALYTAAQSLNGEAQSVLQNLKTAVGSLEKIQSLLPGTQELAQRANSCHIELKDIAQEVEAELEKVDFDPSEQEAVDNRLDKLYSLQQKYHAANVEELIGIYEKLRKELGDIDNSDGVLEEKEALVASLRTEAEKKAAALHKLRLSAAKKIEKEMLTRLKPLGLPNVRFSVSVEDKELSSDGADRVSFLFSANPGTPMQPVSQVASGGEIARVMLALKAMISGAVKLPTIIFDEIDTGVSGKIAQQMGIIMKEMGQADRQVISITHLPQIAAMGSVHYKVFKEQTAAGTNSRMQMLTAEERVSEIAQMLSGSEISEAAISNAKELLGMK